MTGIYRHVPPAEGLNSYPPGIAMPALSAEKVRAVVDVSSPKAVLNISVTGFVTY